MSPDSSGVEVRTTAEQDIPRIIELCKAVYPHSPAWEMAQLRSHQAVFPEGQFVAVDRRSGEVVGTAASLIVLWDDYEMTDSWRDFTDAGFFTNHDAAHGRTLYGAEVMVHPKTRGQGVGKLLYRARRELTQRLGLLRIRAGARLANYSQHAAGMTARDYVTAVVRRQIGDPTLSFQLRQSFHVIAVVPKYLRHDPESLGYAAVIEWLNPKVARRADWRAREVFERQVLGAIPDAGREPGHGRT